MLDLFEHYEKQTCRNRTDIMTPSGRQTLSIPVTKKFHHTPINEVRLSYQENWPAIHWRTIKTAYGGSPYFYFYADEFREVYLHKHEMLTDFTLALFEILLRHSGYSDKTELSQGYLEKEEVNRDYRNYWFPSKDHILVPHYLQVFEHKFGFLHNLSAIDLLFNLGPEAGPYLHSLLVKLDTYYSG